MYIYLEIYIILNICFPSIGMLKCIPSDVKMYPYSYVYPRLGSPALEESTD